MVAQMILDMMFLLCPSKKEEELVPHKIRCSNIKGINWETFQTLKMALVWWNSNSRSHLWFKLSRVYHWCSSNSSMKLKVTDWVPLLSRFLKLQETILVLTQEHHSKRQVNSSINAVVRFSNLKEAPINKVSKIHQEIILALQEVSLQPMPVCMIYLHEVHWHQALITLCLEVVETLLLQWIPPTVLKGVPFLILESHQLNSNIEVVEVDLVKVAASMTSRSISGRCMKRGAFNSSTQEATILRTIHSIWITVLTPTAWLAKWVLTDNHPNSFQEALQTTVCFHKQQTQFNESEFSEWCWELWPLTDTSLSLVNLLIHCVEFAASS